ncbi:MAG: MBL fold metallo-hydrolase [Anaerolineales bacterium]|nr:MBL fold metallo-hydrolase [Anaerolineales bacterium]
MQILPNLFRVPSVVANVFIVAADGGLTVVDTGLPFSHKRILNYVGQLGFAPADVQHILITHADRDHMGGAFRLRQATGARVYAGAMESEAMAHGQETRRLRLKWYHRLAFKILRPMFARVQTIQPDVIANDGDVLPLLGGLHVLATPGHTPGHISFYVPALGYLFAGDSLRTVGGKLRVSSGPNTLDEAQAQASAEKQLAFNPRVILTGHGPAFFL